MVTPEIPDRQGGHSNSTLARIPAERNPGSHGQAEALGEPAGMAVLQPGRASPVPTVKAVPETVSHKAL